MGMIDGSQGQIDPGEFASMPLTLNADLDNILVTMAPGVTITGQIVFENGLPQLPNQQALTLRVNAQIGDPDNMGGMIPTPQPAMVAPDLTFTMKGMMGEFLLRTSAAGQFLKAVLLSGTEDITDTPREFKAGDRVTMILTSRASTLEGNVTDAKGQPTDAGLILFSEDKASWRMNSFKTRRSGTDQAGHYKITGLMPGRYFIAAVPRERLNMPSGGVDTAFFEQLSKEATSLVVGEDEQRQVDLKVVVGDGGL